MAEFPAASWLGYSMNMIATTPLDTNSATKAVQTSRRIISFDEDSTRQLEVDGKLYNVPKAIGVSQEGSSTSAFNTYANGNDAALAFRNDSSLAVTFMAVSGDPSVGAATEKHHRRNVQYAYYCYREGRYLAFLKDYADLLNVDTLRTGIRQLPTPFDGENAEILKKYKDFFQRYGSHIVTKVNYGSHLQLHVWGSNSKPPVNDAWSSNVKADYDGIPSSGEYDLSIKDQSQYKDYLEFKQNINSVYGGDRALAQALVTKPAYSTFENWTRTSTTGTSLLGLVVDELWSLMKGSIDDEISEFAPKIQQAFEFIVNHPKVYKTSIQFVIESDWAEFGLLTPSAVIIKGDTVPPLTQYNETKLIWGKEQSHDYHRQTVQFYVINDGYPIDFYISHGSGGGKPAEGTARATFEGNNYINDQITDDNYNTMWFYQAGVNTASESFGVMPGRKDDASSAWDNLLEQYLDKVYGRS